MLKEDMPQLMFAGHMKYMLRRYGKKAAKAPTINHEPLTVNQ
jgi:hypothetical protein